LVFQTLNWRLALSAQAIGYEQKAASSAHLWASSDPDDIAERQWRFSLPVSTVLLAMLGIVFARAAPRRGRSANVFAACLCFALYYNLAGVARAWVEHNTVPTLPGIYWVNGLLGALLLVFWLRPGQTKNL
jgi:lipopolysaccharide export system permease protein